MKNNNEIQHGGIEDNVIKREDFGSGEFGDHCFRLIQHGIPCDAIVDQNGERCEIRAIGTTDFDVNGDPTILGHCSEEHHQLIKKAVEIELTLAGRSTVFGRNGFGRNSGRLFSRK
jgi:hypothetical protein